ncbi:MAG TPA: DUF547 domain-containing protein [Nevskiales bacterium]|nr:DUF547 domain-containing protein [Nevskiales bacterium]
MRRALSILAALWLLHALPTAAAPRAEAWARWAAHDDSATLSLDHGAWDGLLERYVVTTAADGIHRVRYAAFTPADKAALADYLQRLQAVRISAYPRAEQKAYWINLYNAATLKLVLDHYPVVSITRINISPGLFARGPWGKKLLTVEGEAVSLDDIEHRILRPLWQDPLVHYGVNCASLGCPNLAAEAYTAQNTTRLLESGARAYVNHPRGVRVADGRLWVSSIYVWFMSDFGGSDAGVVMHLRRWADPALAARLRDLRRIDGHDYDWALNEAQ